MLLRLYARFRLASRLFVFWFFFDTRACTKQKHIIFSTLKSIFIILRMMVFLCEVSTFWCLMPAFCFYNVFISVRAFTLNVTLSKDLAHNVWAMKFISKYYSIIIIDTCAHQIYIGLEAFFQLYAAEWVGRPAAAAESYLQKCTNLVKCLYLLSSQLENKMENICVYACCNNNNTHIKTMQRIFSNIYQGNVLCSPERKLFSARRNRNIE